MLIFFYFICQVKGGAAEADGRLVQGDQILAVNGNDFRSATQDYAAAMLKVRHLFQLISPWGKI